MQRFSKSLLIESCTYLAEAIRAKNGLTDRTGTAQLFPVHKTRLSAAARQREEELIHRAVEYGRMQAFQSMADWIAAGSVPMPPDRASGE